jgi:zinc protease
MEDLNAASLDDVREWFRAYYGPANATLVLCGDVTAAEALKKVQHYFGDIPPGPPVARPVRWIAKRTGTQRVSVEERVPAARLQFVWNTPGWGETDSHLLDLAASVLGRGEGSRLYERLVRKEALATDVSAEQDENEIAGQFSVTATAALGADLMKLEAVLREEVTRFVDFGPTAEELAIEKTKTRAGFLRRVERLGGFGGRTDLLASSQVFGGRPDAWKGRLATMFGATPERVQQAASRWLADGVLVVETRPVLRWKAAKEGADRSSMPPVAAPADPKFPEVTKATLPNGLRIVVARRAESPLVRLDLLVDAGFAADPADAPGTARLAGSLLTDGTASKNALELRRAIDSLGAELNVTTATDTTQLTLSGLRASLGPSLKLLADVALHPAFPADALETRRRAQLAEVEREGVDARGMVQRVLPRLLYGEGHPYAQPGSGTGTRDAVKKLSRDDLAKFHGAWFRPGSTTLVATGDLTAADLAPLAASAFAGWEAGAAPAKSLPAPGAGGSKSASRVFLLDRPGAPQSVVLAAQLVPARGGPEETPLEIVHTVLGGSFISRINMNLREDKHWSYGARSDIRDTRGLRVLSVSAGVQTDKTAESLAEVVKEVRRISGTEPPTAAGPLGVVAVGRGVAHRDGRLRAARRLVRRLRGARARRHAGAGVRRDEADPARVGRVGRRRRPEEGRGGRARPRRRRGDGDRRGRKAGGVGAGSGAVAGAEERRLGVESIRGFRAGFVTSSPDPVPAM